MSDWLYPLSSKSGFWFEFPDGSRTDDTSPAAFEASVLKAHPDKQWTVARNYRRISPRDRVWVYYGQSDGDLGVVGLAAVTKVDDPSDGRADVHLKLDKARTKRLILNPFPAPKVRKYVPWPRAAVENLSEHPQLVRQLERYAGGLRTNAKIAKPAPAKESTITYNPPAQITVHRRHDSLIGPVRTRLETCGWQQIGFDVSPRKVDLAMAKRTSVLLIEFKTVAGSTFKPVREAFAQLHEYDWRYRKRHPKHRSKVHMWAVLESQPEDDDIQFLEDSGVLVSWASPKKRRLIHGLNTRARLVRLSVVP